MVNKKKIISVVLLLSIVVFFIVTIVSVKVSENNSRNKPLQESTITNIWLQDDIDNTKVLVHYHYKKHQAEDIVFYQLHDSKDNLLLEESLDYQNVLSGYKTFEIYYDFIYKQLYKVKISLNDILQDKEVSLTKSYRPSLLPWRNIAGAIPFNDAIQLSYFLDFSYGLDTYTVYKYIRTEIPDPSNPQRRFLIGELTQGEIEYEIRKVMFEDLEPNTDYWVGICIDEFTPPGLEYSCVVKAVKTLN